MSSSLQEPTLPSKRRTRRSTARRPVSVDTAATGPLRPKKKPTPPPSGELCGFGIACHFGTRCVHAHTATDLEFFTKKDDLKLQLRQMNLQVEQEKINFQRQKSTIRQPFTTLDNKSSVVSNRGAASPASAAKTAATNRGAASTKQPRSQQKPAASPVPQPEPLQHPSAPRSPRSSPPPSGGNTTPMRPLHASTDPHMQCAVHRKKCSQACAVRTANDNPRWVGQFQVRLAVWGRSRPAWDVQPPPESEQHVLHPGAVFTVDSAAHWHKHDQWLRDCDSGLWFPTWKEDNMLIGRLPNS